MNNRTDHWERAQMHARPIFLARPNRLGGLAPIYSAIVALVAVSVIAFTVVLWPADAKPCEATPAPHAAAAVARTLGGTTPEPSDVLPSRPRGRWM
jgi:hypothetical protein